MNKILFVLIIIFLLLGIVDWVSVMSSNRVEIGVPVSGFAIAKLFAILMMLFNGTFRNTIYFKIAMFFFGIMLVGALFKILHYPAADELILLFSGAIAVVYSIHFFKKEGKGLLDYLKLVVVVVLFAEMPIRVLHWLSFEANRWLSQGSLAMFWITFIVFVVDKRKTLF